MEYFELLNEKGEKLGKTKERNAVHRDGDLHGGSHIWVIRRSPHPAYGDTGIEVLLQKRRADKDSFPGCLDVSCAGHMTEGEDFVSTALRELKEELGLSAQAEDLIFLHDQLVGGDFVFHGEPFRNYEVNHVYLLRPDFPLTGLHYQEEEISGLVWQDAGKIRRLLAADSADYCINHAEMERLFAYLTKTGAVAQHRILEVCADSVESAVAAARGGADRLELCSDLAVGGVTPSLALYERVRECVKLPVHVLLRPRPGDFLYSEEDFEVLRRQTLAYKKAGADALVIGCLTKEGQLNREQMRTLMEIAEDTPVTLHRAFDMCADLTEALAEAKKLGVRTILTSGGCGRALEGAHILEELFRKAGPVEIMAGAGINAEAIETLRSQTSLRAFHMSGKQILPSAMEYRNPRVHMGLPGLSEYERWQTDEENVRLARETLDR